MVLHQWKTVGEREVHGSRVVSSLLLSLTCIDVLQALVRVSMFERGPSGPRCRIGSFCKRTEAASYLGPAGSDSNSRQATLLDFLCPESTIGRSNIGE